MTSTMELPIAVEDAQTTPATDALGVVEMSNDQTPHASNTHGVTLEVTTTTN